MDVLRNKEGRSNIRLIIFVFVVLSGIVAALLYFPPIPTRTEPEKTSGDITFLDGAGNPISGAIELIGAGVSSGLKPNVNFISWTNVPDARIRYEALETKNIAINLRMSGNSPKSKVILENYGANQPGNVNISAPQVPIKYVEISPIGVSFAEAGIFIRYTDAELYGLNETSLVIYRYDNVTQTWSELATTVDANNNIASATVNSLSVFAVAAPFPEWGIIVIDSKDNPINTVIEVYENNSLARSYPNVGELYIFPTASAVVSQAIKVDSPQTQSISQARKYTAQAVSQAIKVDSLSRKNTSLKLENAVVQGNGRIILDDFGKNNPVSVPVPGKPVKYLEIGASSISYSSAEVTIKYSEAELDGTLENNLHIFHWDGAAWVLLPTTIDAMNNTLSATATSLSPFAVSSGTSPNILLIGRGGTDSSSTNMNTYLTGTGATVTTSSGSGLNVSYLNTFDLVIYTQGVSNNQIQGDTTFRTLLKDYMNTGKGRLIVEGEDVYDDAINVPDNSFITDVLKATTSSTADVNKQFLSIQVSNSTHPVNYGLASSSGTDYDRQEQTHIVPGTGAQIIQTANTQDQTGRGAVNAWNNESAKKRVVYMGFAWFISNQNPPNRILNQPYRETLLHNAVNWVRDFDPPDFLNITYPPNGSTLNGTVRVNGTARDNQTSASGIRSVLVSLDNGSFWDTAAISDSGSFVNYVYELHTTTLSNTNYRLIVKAVDINGYEYINTTGINFTVDNQVSNEETPNGTAVLRVFTNRKVILDDPNTGANLGTGFQDTPKNWESNFWSGENTLIRVYALLLGNNGKVVPDNTKVNFTLKGPQTAIIPTTNITNTTRGVAGVSFQMNAKNSWGFWTIEANATINNTLVNSSTTFIYNWWGCGNCHSQKTPPTGGTRNSVYLGGNNVGEAVHTARQDHYNQYNFDNSFEDRCTRCHQSYDGNKGRGDTYSDYPADFHGTTSNTSNRRTCANCHVYNITGTGTPPNSSATIPSCFSSTCHPQMNFQVKQFNTTSSGFGIFSDTEPPSGSPLAAHESQAPESLSPYVTMWPAAADPARPVTFDSGLNFSGNTFGLAGADDGWDSQYGTYTTVGAGNTTYVVHNFDPNGNGDQSDNTVATDKRIKITIDPTQDITTPKSAAAGIEVVVTSSIWSNISAGNRLYLKLDYRIDSNGGGGLDKQRDAYQWIKARFNNTYIGSNLDSGADADKDIAYLRGRGIISATSTTDVTQYVNGTGNYYIDMGGKMGAVGNDILKENYAEYSIDNVNLFVSTRDSKVYCIICHTPVHNITKPDPSPQNNQNNVTEDTNCRKCHTGFIRHNNQIQCTQCHSQNIHSISYIGADGAYTFDRKQVGNCITCHNKNNTLQVQQNLTDKGLGNAPKITTPVNHSSANAGRNWGSYWSEPVGACYYCHGDTKHTGIALGRIARIAGNNTPNATIRVSPELYPQAKRSAWCAGCHYNGTVGTEYNYMTMKNLYTNATGLIPPLNHNGTNWMGVNQSVTGDPYFNHTLSFYYDDACFKCHSIDVYNDTYSRVLVHNVQRGISGAWDCQRCHDINGMAPKHIDIGIMKASVHRNLNLTNDTNSTTVLFNNVSYDYSIVKSCWACHGDGYKPSQHPSTYKEPSPCVDCHRPGGNKTLNYSAPQVYNHFRNGTEIKARTNATSDIASCIYCHEQDPSLNMVLNNSDPDTGSFIGDNISVTGGNGSFYHYGKNIISFGKTPGSPEYCRVCHNSTNYSTLFLNASRYSLQNHSLRYPNSSPGCDNANCHNSTGSLKHSINLKKPQANSTLCLGCHGANGTGFTNFSGVTTGVKNRHNSMVNCTECHLGSGSDIHPMKYMQPDASYNTSNSTAVNCINCHQNTTVYPNLTRTPPKIPNPLYHSEKPSNGTLWNSTGYWNNNSPITMCMYCHNDSKHSASALGRLANWKGDNVANSNITSSSTWCAGCHYQRYSSGGKNYANMTLAFTSANLPVPPEITGNTTYGSYANDSRYYNHSLTNYTDADCKKCHGINLTSSDYIKAFVHNITWGGCKDCHFSFIAMNTTTRPERYVNSTMFDAGPHRPVACQNCHTKGHKNIGARKACEDCHAVQQDPLTDRNRHNITRDPWSNKINGISAVNITDCTTCHDAAPYSNATSNYGYNKTRDCDYCHTYPDKTYS